jgi:UDP-glucose 4-epimerase
MRSPSVVSNLDNSRDFSVRDIIQPVERTTSPRLAVQHGPRRARGPAALVSDATKARDCLGWQPQIAQLDEIVRIAWAWHQNAPSIASRKVETAVA